MIRYLTPLALGLLFACIPNALAQQGEELERRMAGLDVESLVISSQVRNRLPVDTLDEVSATQDQVFCWTLITGAEEQTTIQHVWYREDREMARIELPVGGPNWRTWSSKRLLPVLAGDWRIDVVGPDGQTLDSVTFQVVQSEEGPGR